LDAAIADEDAAFFHNHGGCSDGAFQPTALQNSHDASGFDRRAELALNGELVGEKNYEVDDWIITEVANGWKDLSAFL
jgi:hypothetical protein